MKFVLLSRHTDGSAIPENATEQALIEMGDWVSLLRASVAMPIRGGKSITATTIEDYVGDLGGVLIFEADNIAEAVQLAQKSPGLKYGFTHEVFPELSMAAAAGRSSEA